jgi:hypothetical protein
MSDTCTYVSLVQLSGGVITISMRGKMNAEKRESYMYWVHSVPQCGGVAERRGLSPPLIQYICSATPWDEYYSRWYCLAMPALHLKMCCWAPQVKWTKHNTAANDDVTRKALVKDATTACKFLYYKKKKLYKHWGDITTARVSKKRENIMVWMLYLPLEKRLVLRVWFARSRQVVPQELH